MTYDGIGQQYLVIELGRVLSFDNLKTVTAK